MGKIILALALTAAAPAAMAQNLEQNESFLSTKRGAAIVLFSGVGGGVLGLSTLSFYGKPEEHASNITTGALVGVAVGLGYVLWENSAPAPAPAPQWGWAPREGGSDVTYRFSF